MIKVIIADDEEPAREELKYLLGNYPDIRIIDEASDGKTALRKISQHIPDVVFLDIHMPSLTGIETAEKLIKLDRVPHVVFVTAFDAYAIHAFELHAVDYLLKPLERKRLDATILRLRGLLNRKDSSQISLSCIMEMIEYQRRDQKTDYITICDDDRFYPIKFDSIKYAYADAKKTFIITTDGSYQYKKTLAHLEELLPDNFFKTHRSYIVNVKYIKKIDSWFNGAYQLTICGEGKSVPLSRSCAPDFKKFMNME